MQTCFDQGDYQNALECLESSSKTTIDPYKATLMKATCYYKLKDYGRARALLVECARLNGDSSQHRECLAKIHIAAGDLAEAMTQVMQLIHRNPNHYYYYVLRAKVNRLKQELAAAVKDLHTAEQCGQADYKVYKHLGLCYFDNDYETSLRYFRHAEAMDKTKLSVVEHIGYLHMRLDEYNKALTAFKRALELRPDNKKYFYLIGLCHVKLDQKTEALNYLKTAISIDSNDPNLFFMAGITEREIGHYREAICNLERSLASGQTDNVHEKYNEMGLCYMNLKDYAKAAEYLLKAVEANPDYAEGYSNLGLCHYLSKDYKRALSMLNKAVALDPYLIAPYSNLGLVYTTIENYKEAERCFNKVVIYNEYRYDALIRLGTIKMKRKKYRLAKEYFKTAVELDNTLPIGFYNLGLVYVELHKCKKARLHFNKALQCDPQFSLAKKSIESLNSQVINDRFNKKRRPAMCIGFWF